MRAVTFNRYEKKFLMDREIAGRILPRLSGKMVPDEHCRNGEPYRICNLYFDTDRDDVIRYSLDKPYYKEKFRLRSYGYPDGDGAEVFAEIKKKTGHIVSKRRAVLSYGEIKAFLADGTVPEGSSYMTAQVLSEIAYYLSRTGVGPSTFLTYERLAFQGKEDPSFRVTFDRNIAYKRGNASLSDPAEKILLMPEGFRLMEVKSAGAYPKWFADLLCSENVYASSFSKYGEAYRNYLADRDERSYEHVVFYTGL